MFIFIDDIVVWSYVSIVVRIGVGVLFFAFSASNMLYLLEASDTSMLLLLFLLSVMHIDVTRDETSELLVFLFDVEWF